MKRLISGFCLAVAAQSSAQSVTGDWSGYWLRAGDTLPVTLSIRSDSGGRVRATFSSERLRVSHIPFAQVTVSGCGAITMLLKGDVNTTTFMGMLGRDSLTGTFDEAGQKGTFAFARTVARRAAFMEHDIVFKNGAVTLAGTILRPSTARGVAGVVFFHGSGAEGRPSLPI